MKKFLFGTILTSISLIMTIQAFGGEKMRVYCTAEGVALELKPDQDYTEKNSLYSDVTSFVIDSSSIPKTEYMEQLACNGNSLMTDVTRKPEWAKINEKIEQREKELDVLLAEENPDPVSVIRIQREIQKMEKQKKSILSK